MLEQQKYLGTYIGGYQLTDQLSTNSSSYTFLAETASRTDRQRVVIKWHYAVHLTTQQEKKDFLRKASTLKRLQQPFILPTLAAGLFIDTPYIVTPYMSQGSLYDRIHNPITQTWLQEHAITIIRQIGQALAYSHQQNVAHGKLHPSNILFNERDEVQLTDFQLVAIPITLVETASIPVNTTVGQKLEYHRGLATKDNDYHALGNIAHELFIGCKSPTNRTPNILSNSQNNIPPMANGESHFRPISYTEETSIPEPSQSLSDISDISDISTLLSALNIPTEISSSVAVPDARTLPVLAVKASTVSTNESSTQNGTSTIISCIDTHTSMKTPTLSPTPPPVWVHANRGTIKNLLLPIKQKKGTRGDIIRRLPRDQGSLFLLSGILCIIIFSLIGTQFTTVPHTHSTKRQRELLLNSTTVDLTTPLLRSSEIANTNRLIYQPTPIDLSSYPMTPATVQHIQSTPGPIAPLFATPYQDQFTPLTVNPTYLYPQTCKIIGAYYTCTVTLALRTNYQRDQSWYSSSSTTAALSSPASGFITRGSHVPITIQIGLYCYGSGTITFIGNNTKASLTWSC